MTRRRAELGTIETGDLNELVRTKITRDIVEAIRNRRVGDQLVIESNALRNKEDDSIKFYERGTISASKVGEKESISSKAQDEPTYSGILTATADKYAVYDAISREAISDARVDVIDGVTEEMGEALADKKDEIILKRLCNDKQESDSDIGNSSSLTNTPVLSIDNLSTADTPGDVEYSPATGSIISGITGTATVTYTTAQAPSVDSTDSPTDEITMDSVAAAKYKITKKRMNPDALVVSPKFISFLEQNVDFQDAATYAGELPQGVEGKLYNMNIVLSDNLPGQVADKGGFIALLVDSDKAMPYLPKEDVGVDRFDNKDEQVMEIFASERYAVGGNSEGSRLLRDNAVSVLAIDHAA